MPRRRSHAMPTPPVRLEPREGGGLALVVDGATQSVTHDEQGYWASMIPSEPPTRALLLGLGGGTLARLLADRWPQVEITGIERDERIIAVGRDQMGLGSLPQLVIVHAEVFKWVAARSMGEPESQDYIAHDLYVGARMVPGGLGTSFLRQLATLLTPGGWLVLNLTRTKRLSDHIERVERVFGATERRNIGGNVVLLARKSC